MIKRLKRWLLGAPRDVLDPTIYHKISLVAMPDLQAEEDTAQPSITSEVTDVELTAYVCGERRMTLRAARAVPGRARLGFFQTALIPTMELEHVTFERPRPDGSVEVGQLPAASVNWLTKHVTLPDGTPLFELRVGFNLLGRAGFFDRFTMCFNDRARLLTATRLS